jgi:hypothetical protein
MKTSLFKMVCVLFVLKFYSNPLWSQSQREQEDLLKKSEGHLLKESESHQHTKFGPFTFSYKGHETVLNLRKAFEDFQEVLPSPLQKELRFFFQENPHFKEVTLLIKPQSKKNQEQEWIIHSSSQGNSSAESRTESHLGSYMESHTGSSLGKQEVILVFNPQKMDQVTLKWMDSKKKMQKRVFNEQEAQDPLKFLHSIKINKDHGLWEFVGCHLLPESFAKRKAKSSSWFSPAMGVTLGAAVGLFLWYWFHKQSLNQYQSTGPNPPQPVNSIPPPGLGSPFFLPPVNGSGSFPLPVDTDRNSPGSVPGVK